jgi:hypothetical protein
MCFDNLDFELSEEMCFDNLDYGLMADRAHNLSRMYWAQLVRGQEGLVVLDWITDIYIHDRGDHDQSPGCNKHHKNGH